MRNPHGSFIWYELLTSDPDAAGAFYYDVIGWTAASAGQEGVDYRIFSANGTGVGGHMKLPAEAADAGARPGWIGYIGVDDVDAAVGSVTAAGGSVHMPAMDIPGVGRMALLADPQRVPFYVMRGAMDEASGAFSPTEIGRCTWNELTTTDDAAALAFYTQQFGWEKGDAMPMGEMGDYRFIHHDGQMLGAVMRRPPQQERSAWQFYFRVADIRTAAERVQAGGGTVHEGPMEVPGGDLVIVASDPQGARFGLVAQAGQVSGETQ